MVVGLQIGKPPFFSAPDGVLHSGWLPGMFPLPRAAPADSQIKGMLAEMFIEAFPPPLLQQN